jgi:hypothetical protein
MKFSIRLKKRFIWLLKFALKPNKESALALFLLSRPSMALTTS